MKTWEEIKQGGSGHYKTGSVEPIDLYRSLGILREWAIGEICQHALRNIKQRDTFIKDMDKFIHYAEMLKAAYGDPKVKGK